MKITQVRNGHPAALLCRPPLSDRPHALGQRAFPGFEGTANSQLRNPLVELPIDELVDMDTVIVTHDHPDHKDDAARALIPKHLPLLLQNIRKMPMPFMPVALRMCAC